MADDAPGASEHEGRIADLEAVVAQEAELIESQRQAIERREALLAELPPPV